MTATLQVTYANGSSQTLAMPAGTWLIGRDQGDIILGDNAVSGRHGQLELTEAGLSYTDLGSTNGSFLPNGQRVSGSIALTAGAQLRLGGCTLLVRALPQAEAAVPPRTEVMPAVPSAPVGGPQQSGRAPAAQRSPAAMEALAAAGEAIRGVARALPDALPTSGAARAPAPPMSGTDSAPSAYSHPEQPVRHSYPLAIRDAGIGTAVGLMMKTLPYAMARFFVLVAMSFVSIVWFIVTFGGMAWLGAKWGPLGLGWAVFGSAAYGYVWWAVVRYFLYLLKCGHIAVLTDLITTGSVANGNQGMFQYGKDVVKQRFGQVNALFVMDRLVHGIVRAFNRTLNWVANLLPIPGLQGMVGVANKVLYAATTYVDETIFSYNLARGDDNPWRSSRDGLIYYAQNSKEVLKTGVWIVVLDYILSFVTWLLMLAPAFVIAFILPKAVATGGGLLVVFVAVLFASNIRAAFLRPLFLTMMMIRFHVSAQDQPINEEWDGRLTSASQKFGELKDRALGFNPAAHSAPVAASV